MEGLRDARAHDNFVDQLSMMVQLGSAEAPPKS
jgi:hypothetical protein